MHHKIAVVGEGITGIMTALACAQRAVSVDLYDMDQIPNKANLSWDYGRLWRHIHEKNTVLQSLAALSQPFWQELIHIAHGNFGCQTQSVRVLNNVECQHYTRFSKMRAFLLRSMIDIYQRNLHYCAFL